MENLSRNKQLLAKWASLEAQYTSWRTLHKDVAAYILPMQGNFLENEPNSANNTNRMSEIINDAAVQDCLDFGAGMQGGLCSAARPWFKWTMIDRDLAKFGPVRAWLDSVEKIMYRILSGSNFYTTAKLVFSEQGGFGTSAMFIEDHLENTVLFKLMTAGEYRIAVGPDGFVDTLYRQFWMTAKAMEQKFGSGRLSTSAQAALSSSDPFKFFKILHAVEPRKDRDVNKIDAANKPFASTWIEPGEDQKTLAVSGYDEQPFVAPRFYNVSNSAYGMGPGIIVLGNAKQLQEMERTGLKSLHREVDPPLDIPAKYKGIVSLLPGAANYSDEGGTNRIEPILKLNTNLEGLEYKIDKIERRIGRAMFKDLFQMIANADVSGREITATEILERKQEKMQLLSPAIEGQIHEFLDPCLSRVFSVAFRAGMLPPPPEDVEGQEMDVEYISILAQAQQLADAQNMQTYMLEVQRIMELDPNSAIAKTDFLEYLDHYGDVVGVPSKIIRSNEDAEKMIAQMQQAQQQAEQAEKVKMASESAKNMGSASTESGTALGDLMQSMGGA